MTDQQPPDEVTRLRARVAELEARIAAETTSAAPAEGAKQSDRHRLRSTASGILVLVACLLAPLSVASVWASSVISDTDQYVATVAPLADDPDVQQAIAAEVTAAIVENLEIEDVTTRLLESLASGENVPPDVAALVPGLAVPLTNGIESFTGTQVARVLASSEFAQLWEEVNRIAHAQVVALLSGDQSGAVSAADDSVTLNLAPIIEQVKERLVDQGFSLAQNLPVIDRSFVLVQSGSISDAQLAYQLLNALGLWLPFVALALFAVGVALAGDRRRALLKGALGVAAAMLALGVVLTLARLWYVGATPADILTEEAAGSVFDTLVRFLRTGLRALGILALIVWFAALVSGPSTGAVRARSALTGGIGSMRSSAESAGFDTGRFGAWVHSHRRGLRIGALVVGGLLLMSWDRPSGWVVIGTAVVVVLFLGLVEFLGRPPTDVTLEDAAADDLSAAGSRDPGAASRR